MQNCVQCNKTRTGLVQLIRAIMPDVPNQTPMPQPSKQMLNGYPIPPMHNIVQLLPGSQSSILSSNEWHNDMKPAVLSAVMAPNLKIKESTTGTRQSIPIPNLNIGRCPRGQGANSYNVAQHIKGNSYLANMQHMLRIPRVSTPYATIGTHGHGVSKSVNLRRKNGDNG